MEKFILNISNALPLFLKDDYVTWIKSFLADVHKEYNEIDHLHIAELTQMTQDGDLMIVLQLHFNAAATIDMVQDILQGVVSATHTQFVQKVLAFGSIMKTI